jgi:hypothetical protein
MTIEREGLLTRQRNAESTAQQKKLFLAECQTKLQKRQDAQIRAEEHRVSAASIQEELKVGRMTLRLSGDGG